MTYVTGVAALAHIQQQQRIVIIILKTTNEPITIPTIAKVDKTAPTILKISVSATCTESLADDKTLVLLEYLTTI